MKSFEEVYAENKVEINNYVLNLNKHNSVLVYFELYFNILVLFGSWLIVMGLGGEAFVVKALGGVLFSFMLARHFLFEHEASHYKLFSNPKKNDLLSNVFIGIFFGRTINEYRISHSSHHKFFNTEKDLENSYFNYPSFKFLLFGFYKIFITKSNSTGNAFKVITMSFYLSILVISFYFGGIKSLIIMLVSLFYLFPLLAIFRQIVEHYEILGNNLRNFKSGILCFFWGAAGFKYHLYHHYFPNVPYTELPKLEKYFKGIMNTNLFTISYKHAIAEIYSGKK